MKIFPKRYILALCTFFISVLMYIDRACIGAAKENICTDFDLSNIQWAWIMAIFTLGYALMQRPAGKLADEYGPRKIMAAIIGVWSLLTALTGAAWNYTSMMLVRFLFGGGEAGAFPTLSKIVYKWYPVKERGIIQGINFSGSRLGGAIAYPIVVALIASVGWKNSFVVFGLLGIIIALIWHKVFRDSPEDAQWLSAKEKEYILENREQATENKNSKLLTFFETLKSGNMWMAMIQYIGSNFTFYFTLTWMFPYLKEALKGSGNAASFYAMAPLIGGAIGNWVSGWLVDKIYKTGNLTASRRIPAIAGFTIATVGVIMTTQATSDVSQVLYLTLAIFGADMTLSPSWAFCIDIGQENAGAVSGTMNMAGNLGAFSSILIFGYLADHLIKSGVDPKEALAGNDMFFYICACLSGISIIMWLFMNPNKTIQSK